jgi:5-carboxymethyl-2-hydroxymuconate isomerase
MRLVQLQLADGSGALVRRDGTGYAVLGTDLQTWLAGDRPDARAELPRGEGQTVVAPVLPGKIVAIGLNYLDHVRETGMETPTAPLVFAKFPSSVVGPSADIVIDSDLSERVDWEVELAVVIGRRARNVSVEDALDHVLGYTVANDVSARDVQFADGQWVRGKSFDTFCPIGPEVITADEIENVQDLRLRTRVNGETVQDSTTAEMIFGVPTLVSYCSHSFSLEPGDLLLTGTPWGCGEFMDPRRSLEVGDVVECEVDQIGVLRNAVVAPAQTSAIGGRQHD